MDDCFRMCSVEGVGDLDAQIEHGLHFQRLAIDLVPEGLPFQQFHDDERPSIDFVNFVNRADVRMIQGGSGACLSPESL